MKITKCLCVSSYDDISGLNRLLSYDVLNFFDKIIIVEGRYNGYPRNDGYSPEPVYDFLMSIKKRFNNKISYIVMDNFTQIEKRNYYWGVAKDYDFCVVADSDEWFVLDPKTLDSELERLIASPERCFPIEFINLSVRMMAPRLFRKPDGLHHKQSTTGISHGSIFDENDKEVVHDIWQFAGMKKQEYVKGIRLYHDKQTRGELRTINDCIYQSTVINR